MRISVSKKALAIALSLAMLVTCMAFSFSASAAVVKLWENHFDNPSTSNWNSIYGDKTTGSSFNTGTCNDANFQGYAVPAMDGEDGYMAVGWNNAKAQQRPIGFIVMHQGTTNKTAANVGTYGHAGKYRYQTLAGGSFQPDSGKYAIRLDYQVPDTVDLSDTDIEIYVAFSGKLWSGVSTWGTSAGGIQYMENAGTLVKYPVATISDGEQSSEWQSTTTLVDLTVPSTEYWYTSIIVRASNINDNKLAGAEIRIDNIEIHKYDDAADFPTVTYMYNGTAVGSSSGLAGTAYVKPALTGLPENADITYWADAEFNTPATIPSVYPEASQTIYVKAEKYLANDPRDFEGETLGASIASTASASNMRGEYKISNKYAHSGSQSLELECLGNQNSTKSDKTQFMLTDGDGTPIRLEIGKDYLLSYWVLVPTDAPCDLKSNMWLYADPTKTGSYDIGTTMNLAGGSKKVIFRDNGVSYQTIPKDGQWHHVIRKIDGSKITADGCGYTIVGLSHLSPQEGLYVYVDDMDVICLSDMATESTGRTAYLYRGETEQGPTNLHKYVVSGNAQPKEGAYTSLRLAAKYTAGNSDGDSIMLGGVALPLTGRGIVVGTDGMSLAANGASGTDYKWKSYKSEGLDQYWQPNPAVETDDSIELTYTLRLANMGEAWFTNETNYRFRGFYDVTLPSYYKENAVDTLISNETATIYGETSDAFTFGGLADTFQKDYWFTDLAS